MAYRTSLPLYPTEGLDGGGKNGKNQYKSKPKSGKRKKKKKKDIDFGKVGAALFLTGLGGAITATTYKGGHDSRRR